MTSNFLIKPAFAGILLTLVSATAVSCFPVDHRQIIAQNSEELSTSQIQARAEAITVKLVSERNSGTGTLVMRQGNLYSVITNAHVLSSVQVTHIQTNDGTRHPVVATNNRALGNDDLALIQFRSNQVYQTTPLIRSSPLEIGDVVYSAGFPMRMDGTNTSINAGRLNLTEGRVTYLLPQPFTGGYQVGYSNDVLNGMSGGPVLNQYGELVAINGRGNYPTWGNPYIFEDNTTPPASVRQQMQASSWGIPIQTVLAQVPQLASGTVVAFASQEEGLSSPNSSANLYESRQFRPEPRETVEQIIPSTLESRQTERANMRARESSSGNQTFQWSFHSPVEPQPQSEALDTQTPENPSVAPIPPSSNSWWSMPNPIEQ